MKLSHSLFLVMLETFEKKRALNLYFLHLSPCKFVYFSMPYFFLFKAQKNALSCQSCDGSMEFN